MSDNSLTFTGMIKQTSNNAGNDASEFLEPYVASQDLVEAVNLAIFLRRPLLLEGEPGCGKTRLAHAVASELDLPFYQWDIRSRSRVEDGLYTYDALRRLHDAQMMAVQDNNALDASKYIGFGPLGKAFMDRDRPAVVLIDEIDRADVDFASDLIATLDTPWGFLITEIGQIIRAAHPPVIIITNNQTKNNLDETFIRRCVYHFIKFPDKQQAKEIAKLHRAQTSLPDNLLEVAINRFLELRNNSELRQKPGMREFLDWLALLHTFGTEPYSAEKLLEDGVMPYQEAILKITKTFSSTKTGELQQDTERKLLIELRKAVTSYFSIEELRTLCFDLGISYDTLTGEGNDAKVRELVAYFHRRGRVRELIEFIKIERPEIQLG